MNQRRPAAVLAYCIVAVAALLIGTVIGAVDLMRPTALERTIMDVALAYLPLTFVAIGVAGIWFMRWWAVAWFWLLIVIVVVDSLFVPFEGPSEGFIWAIIVNATIISAVIALPPTIIALIYRRQFH